MSYGKSLALIQNIFVRPPTEDIEDDDEDENEKTGSRKRQATVYDAVAGTYFLIRLNRALFAIAEIKKQKRPYSRARFPVRCADFFEVP